MSFWQALRIGSSALSAQRLRLDVISNNIANVETTRTAEGGPYKRQDVVFQAEGRQLPFSSFLPVRNSRKLMNVNLNGVQVAQIKTDETDGTSVFDPTHPDADEEGMVAYPNVNLVVEMTNMLSATRSYEANLSIIEAARAMAISAIEIGS